MDTNWKSSDREPETGRRSYRKTGILLSVVFCLAMAAAFLAASWPMFEQAKETETTGLFEQYAESMQRYSYALYWKQLQLHSTAGLQPAELFVDSQAESQPVNEGSQLYLQELKLNLNETVIGWYNGFQSRWSDYAYFVTVDNGTDAPYTAGDDALKSLAENPQGDASILKPYRYIVVFQFDKNGYCSVPLTQGTTGDAFQSAALSDIWSSLYIREYGDTTSSGVVVDFRPRELLRGPVNTTVVFAVPSNVGETDQFHTYDYYNQVHSLSGYGLQGVMLLFLALVGAAGVIMSRVRTLGQSDTLLSRLPVELCAVAALFVLSFYLPNNLNYLVFDTFSGMLVNLYQISGSSKYLLGLFYAAMQLGAVFFLAYITCLSLAQGFRMGWRDFFRERLWTIRLYRWSRQYLRRFYRWLTAVDLSRKSRKSIVKILLVNFIVLTVLCSIWFFGIIGLILYTGVLYLVLRKYYGDVQRNYARLLEAAREMAEGRLDARTTEDLGPFNALRDELNRVQDGFKHAVQAETKSQQMKTELVTNVSHDLKTPLTAIITYVDLLKDESITAEQRRDYVRTLDMKSQRLKRLIEDLFEMSKASSHNLTVQYAQVDLPALIRQVELEARDALEEAGLEFRYRLDRDKLTLRLDGERTSRIFENLILNAAKYSMPHTRAYVDMAVRDGWVVTEIKNISREALDFDTEAITDRFVRGDQSRNTEGSGLGLAIAKSFTEMQGGRFEIRTDGDLFKAVVSFPLERAAGDDGEADSGSP